MPFDLGELHSTHRYRVVTRWEVSKQDKKNIVAKWMLLTVALAVSGVSLSASAASADPNREPAACGAGQQRWVSENFSVQSGMHSAQAISEQAESLRLELAARWLGTEPPRWSPPCEIVVHASQASYLQAVGRGGRQTTGASLLSFGSDGQVIGRRIDLWGPRPAVALAALAHELTHVVLADRFGQRQLPRWADEGLAMQADRQEKRQRHLQDLHRGLRAGKLFRTVELIQLDRYPPTESRRLFYGQSVSLVSFLTQRGGSAKLVVFLERALQSGYDQALRDTYGIENVAKLEQLWRQHVLRTSASF